MYEMLVEKLRLNCAARELWLPLVPQYAEQINLFKEAADAIEELSVVMRTQKAVLDKFPRWIPVTERLPESGEYVLCFCRANIVCVLRRDKDGDWYENPTHVYMSGFVTHWMPLPEPPEKEKA